MPGILDKVTVDLPATATYARREAEWLPAGEGEGVLVIRQWKGRRAGSRMESDTYHVQEEDSIYGRSFLILNVDDDSQPDVYRCVPTEGYCSCTAGNCRVPLCKHRCSLAALIEDGSI